MPDAITALSAALNNDMAEMRSISQNIANMNTAGYKRQITALSSFQQALPMQDIPPELAINQSVGSLPRIDIYRDMRQGTLKFTGSSFDVAIGDEGFLQVSTDQGVAFTRKGNLQIDEEGRLTLVSGERVAGESGDIYLRNSPFSIDRNGVITQNEQQIDRLRVVQFQEPRLLIPIGSDVAVELHESRYFTHRYFR